MLSVVEFRNVASREDKIAYVKYNYSLTNYSKCMWVGVLTMRPKHDYIVKGSVTLCTKHGRTICVFKAISHEDAKGSQCIASGFLTRALNKFRNEVSRFDHFNPKDNALMICNPQYPRTDGRSERCGQ